jgi:hypothetical protein
MTEPEPRKRSALKKAWATMRKIAAEYAPTPTAITMYPIWETVEKARTFFMSDWLVAMVAATKAVAPPMPATHHRPVELRARTGLILTKRYTPAVTIVAAWIRAETGVGPSMASGSQLKSGI